MIQSIMIVLIRQFLSSNRRIPLELNYDDLMEDSVYGDDAIPIFCDSHGQD